MSYNYITGHCLCTGWCPKSLDPFLKLHITKNLICNAEIDDIIKKKAHKIILVPNLTPFVIYWYISTS